MSYINTKSAILYPIFLESAIKYSTNTKFSNQIFNINNLISYFNTLGVEVEQTSYYPQIMKKEKERRLGGPTLSAIGQLLYVFHHTVFWAARILGTQLKNPLRSPEF